MSIPVPHICMATSRITLPLLVSRTLASQLLRFYDYPDPRRPGRIIKGVRRSPCRPHGPVYVRRWLHGWGIPCTCETVSDRPLSPRFGTGWTDRHLFGRIWSQARARHSDQGLVNGEALHPDTRYGRETEAFVARYRTAMDDAGITLDSWACEQVEMRLGMPEIGRAFADGEAAFARTRSCLGAVDGPGHAVLLLSRKLEGAQPWVRQLAEVLVACEQFEAYSNQRRGRDYYVRRREDLSEAFAYLQTLQREQIWSRLVVRACESFAAEVCSMGCWRARGGG